MTPEQRFGAWRARLVAMHGRALQRQHSASWTERAIGSIVAGLVGWLIAWAIGEACLLEHERDE